MTDAYETLLVTREPGGLVFCTLNRPQALNAMSPKLVDELHAFLDALHDDTDARVVILRGAGRGFCAGSTCASRAAAARRSGRAFRRASAASTRSPSS
jgi:enoyl-CoA hydratase/carnithine racemase